MKASLIRHGEIVVILIALAAPAFGGRMIESSAPAELQRASEPEAIEAPLVEMDNGEDEMVDDPDLTPEGAERANDDLLAATPLEAPPSRWKWSRSLSMGVSSDDNIYLSSTRRESDQIFTLSGEVQLLWGLKKEESFLKVEYSPTLIRFADHSRANSFDQKASIAGQWRMAKLTLGAQIGGQTLSGGDVDVGDRANRRLWNLSLQAKYDYSSKTSFEVNLAPNASDYSNYLDSLEWVNSNWVDYQVLPKTRLGAGLTFGYLKPEGGSAQTYQQALLRLTNPLSGKVTANVSGGIEYRQLGENGGTQTTPVFRVGVSYQPYEGTSVTLEASRRIYSSASMTGQNFIATGGTGSIRQRLFKRFFATVAGGYENAQYESTTGANGAARHDQYFFVRPSVSFAFKKYLNLEVYYQYRQNTSTTALSDFDSNIAGAQAAITF